MVGIANRKQITFSPLQSRVSPTRQQRRRTLIRAQDTLYKAEILLWIVTFFVAFLYPLILNPSLLFDLPSWGWWIKQSASIGLLGWGAIRLFVVLPLAPSQLTGATVDAMEQTPSADEGFFPRVSALVEQVCDCLFLQQQTDRIERQAMIQIQRYWQQLWRRPRRRFLVTSPLQRILPSSSFLLETAA